jgi:hypothetical protein
MEGIGSWKGPIIAYKDGREFVTRETQMGKARLEAFSDGVIAVIITIMVLELKVPRGAEPGALVELAPVFFSYVLSYISTSPFTGITTTICCTRCKA